MVSTNEGMVRLVGSRRETMNMLHRNEFGWGHEHEKERTSDEGREKKWRERDGHGDEEEQGSKGVHGRQGHGSMPIISWVGRHWCLGMDGRRVGEKR